MKLLTKVNGALEEVDISEAMLKDNPSPDQIVKSISIWAPVIILILEFVKNFTGANADRKIDALIATLRVTQMFR